VATHRPAAQSIGREAGLIVETKTTALTGGLILGLGLGGFIDGIALHQIAQWHNMGSAVGPPTTMDAMMQNMRTTRACAVNIDLRYRSRA
jgi:hypothetical protein